MVFPNLQPPIGPPHCDQHAFAQGVSRDTQAQLMNHSYRFVADDETWLYGIFAPQDMQVRPANCSQRHADDRLAGAGTRERRSRCSS